MSIALPAALLALVPAMVGSLPPAPGESAAITAALCNGGTITITLGEEDAPPEGEACHPKGCHAGTCRKDRDHDQGRRPGTR